MKKFVWLALLLTVLGSPVAAQTYEKIQGFCENGGATVTTDGRTSTTKVQRSYPSCQITVYQTGTLTLASIASNSSGTPKSNPFTADSDGHWEWFALDGTYDVKMSGGGLLTPITRSGFWVVTSSGGGGSGITGSGTAQRFPIFTSSTAIGNSVFQQVGTSEFAPAAIGKRINLGTESQQVVEIANASVGGTTTYRLAKLTGAPSTAITATTSDTSKIVGIVISGAGTTGNAQIVQNGNVDCEFDGATTAGNYVGASTTLAGRCTDLGSALPSSGVQVIGRVLETIGSAGNALVYTFTGEQHPSGLNIVQAYNVLVDGGCSNGGVTNVTACLATAIAAANSSGRPLYFPAGTYLGNLVINGLNSLKIFGDGPGRSIIQSAVGTSAVVYANNATGLTHSLTIEDLSLAGFGSGATDHGFYMTPDQPFDLTLRNVRITNTNGNGVYIPTNAFTMLFDGVDVSSIGGNGFDIYGDNTITFLRTYVHSTGSGGTAYRLHSGRFILIGANGIDSGTNASWGLFGDTTAEDGSDAYARVALLGSNVEAWTSTSYGVRVKTGSQLSVDNTHFITGTSITTTAIVFDDADPNLDGSYIGRLDGLSAFTLGAGSAWTSSYPIRSKGIPFLMDGNRTSSYYDTTLAAAVLMPYQTAALNGSSTRGATKFNRLALGTSTNEGFDGNLNFINDNTRNIGTSSAGRPANVYVGTSILMADGSTTVGGQYWTITGGSSPSYAFNDGTIAGRFQAVTGSGYAQLGTTSSHPLKVLTSNTARWQWDTSGNFIVDSGSLTIGLAAGNRPTIGYFSTSVNPGTPGSTTGSIVFGNSSNSFTTTIQSGVSAASRTYTWPTNFGSAGATLTDVAGNGTLSWVVPSSTTALTSTYVGYGAANVLTGTSDLSYNSTTKTLSIVNGSSSANLILNGSSDTSKVNFGAASVPGNQGGIAFPFVGGGNSSGPGIWWSSSASYNTTSGIYLNNGFTFQGANSTHDHVKFAEGTASSSNGTVRWDFQPSGSLLSETFSSGATASAHVIEDLTITSTGTAAANFGTRSNTTIENGSGSNVLAIGIEKTLSIATASAETGKWEVFARNAGATAARSFTVEGLQNYGTVNALGNKSGSFTVDFSLGNYVTMTGTSAFTTVTFSNIKAGGRYVLRIQNNAGGTVTWTPPTAFKYPGGIAGNILTGSANAVDVFICDSVDGTNLLCNGLFDVKNP